MISTIKIEAIGDNTRSMFKIYREILNSGDKGMGTRLLSMPNKNWVAKINGFSKKYKYNRVFMKGMVDYSNANSTGSRGVYYNYFIDNGFYEVSCPVSWSNIDRYFCIAKDGEIEKINEERLIECLKNI